MFYLSYWSTISKVRLLINYFRSNIKWLIAIFATPQNSLNFVNLRKTSIRTNSSSKMERIIEEILLLRAKDSDVKIVIFSQWTDVLQTIERCLRANRISYRFYAGKNTMNDLDEFKVQSNISNQFHFVNFFLYII